MINLDESIGTHIDAAFIPEGNVCWIATANKAGEPDLGPKGSMMVFDKEHLAYWERTKRAGLEHIQANPKVVVMYRDPVARKAWKLHGEAQLYPDGPIRHQVMVRVVQGELDRDPDRQGIAVVIKLNRIMTMAGEVLQQRD